ncbi:OmpH family outer membrane protein [Maribacter sp. MMG018]|uniref:OmpH family outer membrane protein n=1 Tax=Maribacter sp. MMG018 TaxID=2822688 RepID=UPI001B37B77D|nr:OmpH family outer membrane protein [Maribacter sp. MMG018]MBQ4914067.1 OmpH family outer membrane protein [Maribacter sp. MMG018]
MKSKTKVLIFLVTVITGLYVSAQRGVRIGYVDMEYILQNVEEYREASEQLEAKVQKWKIEIEQKQNVVEQMKKDLMAEKVLLTPELIEEREEEIQILEREMIEYQQDRFGPQGDLVLQKRRLIQPIQDQVFNEVQKLGANKKYDFIFDKSADVVMLYSEKRHDISDLVLRGIARTRKISKPKQKADNRSKLDDFEDEEEISEALQERIDKAKEAEEAREKTANEKKEEQLKLREERKKAYEERRKKLLEEREAKRKAKLEERKKDNENSEEAEENKEN